MEAETWWAHLTAQEKARDEIMRAGLFTARLQGDGPITSDWHLPLTNFALVEQMLRDCERLGLGRWLVIAGDLFHKDALSDHKPKQATANWEHELRIANRVMERLLRHFDRIIVTRGNHDERLEKRVDHAATFAKTVQMCLHELSAAEQKRIVVSETDAVVIDTELGPLRACHTRTYSRVQLSYPSQLADIHRCGIAAGHRHHHAIGFSPSGYPVAEIGGMFDAARTEYLERWTTNFPKWQPGYLLLRRGRMYSPQLSGPLPESL